MTAGIAALSPSVQRMPGEDFTSYFLRLFDNRLTYGLTCSQVADLLNAESGQPEYSESKWRKDYKLYVRARNYFRTHDCGRMLADQTKALEKARIQLSDERAAFNRLIRSEARKDALYDELRAAFAETHEIRVPAPSAVLEHTAGSGTLMAVLSDWHIGIEFANGVGDYNPEIAWNRICRYVEVVRQKAQLLGVRRCVVAMAGDMISGIIHTTIRVENRQRLIAQIKTASEYVAGFLAGIEECFDEIDVYGVGGNHSRVSEKDDAMLGEMLDDIIPFYLSAKFDGHPNIRIHSTEPTVGFESFYIGDTKTHVVLAHGDYDDLSEKNIGQLMRLAGDFDVAVVGHLHECAYFDKLGVHVIRGGCLCGSGDEYCLKKRLSGQPSQIMAYFGDSGELEALFPIYF